MTDPTSPYMTTAEVALLLRTSKQRVYNLTFLDKLPTYKMGRKNLYLRTDVEALVKPR